MERYKTWIIVFLVGFILGQWSSGGCRRHGAPAYEAPPPGKSSAAGSLTRPAPAKGELVLGDFESDRELDGDWTAYRVKAERVAEHATRGRYSAKLTYLPSDGASAFMIEGALRSKRAQDWRRFEKLKFDLYNPASSQIRVILQLKDSNGTRYKEDIYLQPETQETISITLENLEGYVKLDRIEQFNLFQWKANSRHEVYLDNVRLAPPSAESQARSQEVAPLRLAAAEEPVRNTLTAGDSWQVAWETSLRKVFREPEKFRGEVKNPVQLSLARHEFESAQVVLVGGQASAQIQATVSDLLHENGVDRIGREALELRRVDYVNTRKPYYPVQHVGDWPDALVAADTFSVRRGELQPIWLTVYAGAETVPGTYKGLLTLTDSNGKQEEVALEVKVWDFNLPVTPTLKTAFDFYSGRLQKAYREFVPGGSVWQGRWAQLQRRYFLAMLENRLWPIWNVNPNTDPNFARDVKVYLEKGMGLIAVGTRGGSSGNNWPTEPEALERIADEYFQYARTLKSYRLMDRAYVYAYDEPKPGHPHVAQVMAALHAADPHLRNLLVMHEAPNPELYADWIKDADILCIRNASFNPAWAKRYRELGKEIWMYVSSPSHPFPTLVIDYPAMSARILPWMCWKYGADGLLYWCVNFWQGDPMSNPASFAKDQNGNGYLFYPGPEGPIPSIRLHALRDGMEDYEYLYRLRELLEQAPEGTDPALLQRAQALLGVSDRLVESLRSYAQEPQVLLNERQAIAETIVELQKHVTSDM